MEQEYKDYKLNKKINPKINIALCLVLGFYFIVLTSQIWLPDTKSKYVTIQPGAQVEELKTKRKLTLTRWEYSKEQKKMQLQFRIENQSFDGKDEYVFSAASDKGGRLEVKSIYQDTEIYVSEIVDVPKRWGTISFRVALAGDDPDLEYLFKIYGNDDNIRIVDKLERGNKNLYYVADTQCSIEVDQKEIAKLEKKNEQLKDTIQQINKAIIKKTNELEFMTEKEAEEATANIDTLRNTIASHEDAITENNKLIQEYQARISKLNEKMQTFQ